MPPIGMKGLAALLGIAILGSGWLAWWVRGREVIRLSNRVGGLTSEIARINVERARLERALQLQTAAMRRAEEDARRRERRLRLALEQLDRRRAALERESLARRREADELRARLAGLSELDACRAAWEWLAANAAAPERTP